MAFLITGSARCTCDLILRLSLEVTIWLDLPLYGVDRCSVWLSVGNPFSMTIDTDVCAFDCMRCPTIDQPTFAYMSI